MTNYTITSGTLNSIFNDPFFVGFQPTVNTWNSFYTNSQPSYPPYNVIKEDDDTYLVEIALAGFDKENLDVTVDQDTLIVKGEREKADSKYAHKGIATRSFTRSFALGEYMEVTDAEFENGMLSIKIEREIPEEAKPKSIRIK